MYNKPLSQRSFCRDTLTVKNFSIKDSSSFVALFRKVFSLPPWNEDWRDEDAQRVLDKILNGRNSLILTASYCDRYAGFIGGSGYWKFFYLDQLFVDPEKQGRGVGKKLLLSFKRTLKQQKIRYIVLLTQKGSPAEKFYTNNGFKTILPFSFFSKIAMIGKL